jgi:hypothetical protein
MSNLTSIIAIIQIVVGIVALVLPIGISSVEATGLIALGLSTLGISQKIANNANAQVGNVKGVW